MGLFDDLFGGFFDFDGNGKTTWDEEWIAANILKDINEQDEEADNTPASFDTGFEMDDSDMDEDSDFLWDADEESY